METIIELQKNGESYFSLLPKDIIDYCLLPLLKYDGLYPENLLGYSFDEKKIIPEMPVHVPTKRRPTIYEPVSKEIYEKRYKSYWSKAEKLYEYFFNNINMNYKDFQFLKSIDGLSIPQIIAIQAFKLLQEEEEPLWDMAYWKVRDDDADDIIHDDYAHFLKTKKEDEDYLYYLSLYYIPHWKTSCNVCQSIIHKTLDCPMFKDKIFLRCHKHHLKHFLINGERFYYTKVPHAEEYIKAMGKMYRCCNMCQ
jgi:hypothetical protein